MMLSSNQYYKQYPSSNFDDLFTFPVDIAFDEEFNKFANSNDDDAMILSELDLSSDSNQYQSSAESPIAEMICGVCGAPATGYNFDQITCESCKAFFRRNALRNTADLKCRFSGSCVINIHTRRQCTYCRLKKCFDIKMRKEWIRTEEEVKLRQIQKQIKQERKLHRDKIDPKPIVVLPIVVRKKKRLLRKSLSIVQPVHNGIFFGLHRNLEESDNVWLNNITHAYQFGADKADCTFIAHYTEEATLSQFMRDESSVITSLIYFYKGVPEFKRLDIDDQVQLIKLNIRNIIHIHRVIIENFEDSPHIAKHMSKWIGPVFHQQMSRTRQRFYRFVKYPLLLKLSLIVFLFSVNSSTTRDTTECENYQNLDKVIEYQDFYTALLWRYLNYLFEEKEAIESMEIIVTQILRYQILMMTMVDHAREISKQDGLHELMETIFGLSRQANVRENRSLSGKSN